MMDALVTTEWLANELGANDLRVVDATYFGSVPGSPDGDPAAAFEKAHIPGAAFFDIAEIADLNSPLPTMLPPPEKFASRMQSLGLGDGSRSKAASPSIATATSPSGPMTGRSARSIR
jgi:thiosulfate/3-mercaptopyruvate sulfurtransferase